ncbi:MAG: nicotinamide-nucleotide amidohydrolase family protein [Planctomycetota bacterium]
MTAPRVALLHVGDELLHGRVVNTGGATLAAALSDAGYDPVAMELAADREEPIAAALRRLAADAEVVVVTGGLGPTPDDITRDAVARAAGLPLITDPELLAEVTHRTKGRAPEQNAKQAEIPEGAIVFRNPVGVAAAFCSDVGGTPVYVLPGVPVELEALLHDALLPDLARLFPEIAAQERAAVHAFGIAEAVLVEKLGELLDRDGRPEVGVTVEHGVLTVTARGTGAAARAEEIRARLGEDVCGLGHSTLPRLVLHGLQAREATVAIAESLTGGLIADALVSLPGASRVLAGAVVAYRPDVKHALLGVPLEVIESEGVVSETVARAMARGVRDRLGAAYGVASTGAAGPDPEEDGTRPGRGFVAVVGPGGAERVVPVRSGGGRNAVRRRFVNAALDQLRRLLEGDR